MYIIIQENNKFPASRAALCPRRAKGHVVHHLLSREVGPWLLVSWAGFVPLRTQLNSTNQYNYIYIFIYMYIIVIYIYIIVIYIYIYICIYNYIYIILQWLGKSKCQLVAHTPIQPTILPTLPCVWFWILSRGQRSRHAISRVSGRSWRVEFRGSSFWGAAVEFPECRVRKKLPSRSSSSL